MADTFKSFMDHLDSNIDWRVAVTPEGSAMGCVVQLKNTGVRGVEAKFFIEKSDFETNKAGSDDGKVENCKDILEIDRKFVSSSGTGVDLSGLSAKVLKKYTHFVYTLK